MAHTTSQAPTTGAVEQFIGLVYRTAAPYIAKHELDEEAAVNHIMTLAAHTLDQIKTVDPALAGRMRAAFVTQLSR